MDPRARRLLVVMLVILGIIFGRTLFTKKAPVVHSPLDYTEQIEEFNGTPTH